MRWYLPSARMRLASERAKVDFRIVFGCAESLLSRSPPWNGASLSSKIAGRIQEVNDLSLPHYHLSLPPPPSSPSPPPPPFSS
ncbi:hypothetical protein DAI22_07g010900 [Oryza sativa Japonica Group]|nr:hypothetical protein DAI22_07g010900 [Oryza sativa Japonica Group]